MKAVGQPQTWLDGLAIGASTLCLVHCLLLPAAIVTLPALATFISTPEAFHRWALLVALPSSALALGVGFCRHRRSTPVLLAGTGLSLLAAALGFTEAAAETLVTVTGASLLGFGHALNWRLLPHSPAK